MNWNMRYRQLHGNWPTPPRSLFLGNFLFVQSLKKEKVGDLLNDFERVGDATRPEGVPDLIDLTANFASKHKFLGE
jgi:hypothetical protein